MTPPAIRAMVPGEAGTLATVLADAFDRAPLAQLLSPDPATRRTSLTTLFAEELALPPHRATVETTTSLDAVAIWYPPGHDLRLTPAPGEAGPAAAFFASIAAAAPPGPFWYLAFLGARAPGTGGGTALLRHGLARIDGPAALWTAHAPNVGFYRRFGFTVVSEHRHAIATAWWMATYTKRLNP